MPTFPQLQEAVTVISHFMRTMIPPKNLILAVLVFVTISCKQANINYSELKTVDTLSSVSQKSNKLKPRNLISNKIYDTIFSLSEVKERDLYIKKMTSGKRHLQIIIDSVGLVENGYYWVKAGEDNGINFVTHFNFFVYPNKYEIKYFDTARDTIINLRTWREETKNGL